MSSNSVTVTHKYESGSDWILLYCSLGEKPSWWPWLTGECHVPTRFFQFISIQYFGVVFIYIGLTAFLLINYYCFNWCSLFVISTLLLSWCKCLCCGTNEGFYLSVKSSTPTVKVHSVTTGRTCGADDEILEKVKNIRWPTKVKITDYQECDIIIVFCPITSRVTSDVPAAMRKIPAGNERLVSNSLLLLSD